jgi:nicotinamide phosphoribosyltransferase
MNNMNPFLGCDGYKTGHPWMYPQGTSLVYSNFTPRNLKHAPKGVTQVVNFGSQMVMIEIFEMFNENFFFTSDRRHLEMMKSNMSERNYLTQMKEMRDEVCGEIKREYSMYLGTDFDVSHIESLWDLGYLPIKVKALPEGTLVPIGVPVLTIYNTIPEFYWVTNFLETIISNLLWKPMTSATIAHQYKKNLTKWALKTDKENVGFVEFQGHDFSMRGMDSVDATISSGLGHATSFMGSDSLPVIYGARKYYGETGFVIGSVNATEHSVMCAGNKDSEIETFEYLMKQFPTGILSIVSDTWDLWKVITEYLVTLKDEIMTRDGKIVIRPDSGNPVDIICGTDKIVKKITDMDYLNEWYCQEDGKRYHDAGGSHNHRHEEWIIESEIVKPNRKGVIELLWDLFGGTINDQGYKVLDSHIGAIYGDAITLERAEQICERLEAKGFASTNVVLGIGSFTYQYNTRDTFGFAMKATYVEIKEVDQKASEEQDREMSAIGGPCGYPIFKTVGREIFKDPITDGGGKKSAKGLLTVEKQYGGNFSNSKGDYVLYDQVSWEHENKGFLETIFMDGVFHNTITLGEIRANLNKLI